jgi:hypothetical protein
MSLLILLVFFGVSSFHTSRDFEGDNMLKKESLESKYNEGFKDGHCEGWKDEKGKYAYCPYPPYPEYPEYPKSSDSYRDGYNDGFKRGIRDARK